MKDRKGQDMQGGASHVFPYAQHILFHGDLKDKIVTLKEL